MKLYLISLSALAFLLLAGAVLTFSGSRKNSAQASSSSAPVIVELFTSEGCSSCPPADALLLKLDKQGTVGGVPIIVLEEHVDYWDHQGWKDPFSSAQWTSRQADYASLLRRDSVYTPQMIVDGWDEFVGSREEQARAAIVDASRKPKATVDLQTHDESPWRIGVTIVVHAVPPALQSEKADVWLAVTERGLHINVLRGENAGEDLYHSDVLRILRRVGASHGNKEPSFSGEEKVDLGPEWKRENLRFVAFVQDPKTMHILGAAAMGTP